MNCAPHSAPFWLIARNRPPRAQTKPHSQKMRHSALPSWKFIAKTIGGKWLSARHNISSRVESSVHSEPKKDVNCSIKGHQLELMGLVKAVFLLWRRSRNGVIWRVDIIRLLKIVCTECEVNHFRHKTHGRLFRRASASDPHGPLHTLEEHVQESLEQRKPWRKHTNANKKYSKQT